MPLTFWTFAAGAASLSALPLVTAGFYSKDQIIFRAWASDSGSAWLWAAGIVGAFITALYTFRMLFITFYGKTTTVPSKKPGVRMMLPLVVLAVLSIVGGFVETPETMGHVTIFSDLLRTVVHDTGEAAVSRGTELLFQLIAVLVVVAGITLAWYFYLKNPDAASHLVASPAAQKLYAFWKSGWGFDRLYDMLFVNPYVWIARVNKADAADWISKGIARATVIGNRLASQSENGHLRRYAAAIAAGAVIIVAIMVFS